MIKKIFVCLAFAVITITINAQNTLKFAYFNYTEVLKSMPEYAAATRSINDLRAKYDAETTRSENDFHTKYEEFLEGQRNFAPSILKKRQAELQELLDKNIAFKKEANRLIEQAEQQIYAPVHAKLKKTIAKMAQESGYAFILNADNNALPYVNNMVGEDITVALKTALQ
ncbi:OmpH family outer membrane protein [Prevotella pallens]|jgi:outer membrane protein|uniref:OmpH family outer membrane protein n=1 Tax=Prevotella pallens TaxID=60133 RepID=UPI001CAC674F|nr:OmpH family outer membrane protein [Prevotella pallens]